MPKGRSTTSPQHDTITNKVGPIFGGPKTHIILRPNYRNLTNPLPVGSRSSLPATPIQTGLSFPINTTRPLPFSIRLGITTIINKKKKNSKAKKEIVV
jgi:hypothetical protein